jgi:hypothetical protein
MKVLDGELTETMYEWPEKSVNEKMSMRQERILQLNESTYINGNVAKLIFFISLLLIVVTLLVHRLNWAS